MRTFLFLLLPGCLFAQLHLQQIGHLPYAPVSLAGCWHYVDSTGGEYALVGTSIGLSIVDLHDPTQPVERFTIPGPQSNWREVKTHGGFAYFGSEAEGSGITIVDLRPLPDTVFWKVWYGDGLFDSLVVRSHTVQAADGYLYIFGGGNVTNGAIIADLNDPWNPHILSKYTNNYVHDGLLRGDTLWTSEIYQGQFGVVDIFDRTNPQLIITNPTPGAFNHNCDLSPDGKTLFTTDEKSNAPLGAFDVSNLANITLLDTYKPSRKPTFEVHNVRVKGNYLVNPSYGGQLTIVDATLPDNLIETAWVVVGNSLVWDADPYLPSGIIFASAKNEGLFIFQPTYQHAAWLEGIVTDSVTGLPVTNALAVVLNDTTNRDNTDFFGVYKTGSALPGNYDITFSRDGYESKTITDVVLQTNLITTLNVVLKPLSVGVKDVAALNYFEVSPRIFQSSLTVNCASRYLGGTLSISNMQGRVFKQQVIQNTTTQLEDLQNLPVGSYIMSIHAGGSFYTLKLIKD